MNTCPLCDKKLNFTNMSLVKIDDKNLCQNCVKILTKNILIHNIKKHSIDELKQIIKNDNIKNEFTIECPSCHSHDINIISTDKNYKEKYKTTLNLNPFKIFTISNTKKIVKETSEEHNEYLCKNCGKKWIGK